MEPQQRLARAAKFLDLVEDQRDRRLHAPIRILLEAVSGLDEADRRRDDEFAAAGFLVAGGQRALAQKVELVLVEAPLEPEQQSVVAVSGRIDRLLIDENRVDDAAHLDQLLPVAAVAGEARDLAGADGADLAEADLGHHPFEARALHAAGRRAAEIVVDHLDLGKTQRRQPVPHGVLQRRRSRGCAAPGAPKTGARRGSPCAQDDAGRSCQRSWPASALVSVAAACA